MTELLNKVKQWNKTAVVDDFYMAGVITKYSSFVPKIINTAFDLTKLWQKNIGLFFVDTVYYTLWGIKNMPNFFTLT